MAIFIAYKSISFSFTWHVGACGSTTVAHRHTSFGPITRVNKQLLVKTYIYKIQRRSLSVLCMCIKPFNIYSETSESNLQTLPWHVSSRLQALQLHSCYPPHQYSPDTLAHFLSIFWTCHVLFNHRTFAWACSNAGNVLASTLQWVNPSYPLDLSLIDTSSEKSALIPPWKWEP